MIIKTVKNFWLFLENFFIIVENVVIPKRKKVFFHTKYLLATGTKFFMHKNL